MKSEPDGQIRTILEMSERMIVISDEGLLSSVDDGCLLLNGMVREFAYRLRDAADLERKIHSKTRKRDGGKARIK